MPECRYHNLVAVSGSCEIATNLIETGPGVDAEVCPNQGASTNIGHPILNKSCLSCTKDMHNKDYMFLVVWWRLKEVVG